MQGTDPAHHDQLFYYSAECSAMVCGIQVFTLLLWGQYQKLRHMIHD